MLFRSGYKKDFPRIEVNNNDVIAALAQDRERREERGKTINSSNHRMHTAVVPNQIVLVRNNNSNKFDQVFGPVLHKVVDVIGNEVTLHRQSGSQILHRHLHDTKLFHRGDEDMYWVESAGSVTPTVEPQQPQQHQQQQQQLLPQPDNSSSNDSNNNHYANIPNVFAVLQHASGTKRGVME